MLKHKPKLKSDLPFITLVIFVIYLTLCYSCKTLQQTEGFEKYPQNTDWKTRKL